MKKVIIALILAALADITLIATIGIPYIIISGCVDIVAFISCIIIRKMHKVAVVA